MKKMTNYAKKPIMKSLACHSQPTEEKVLFVYVTSYFPISYILLAFF